MTTVNFNRSEKQSGQVIIFFVLNKDMLFLKRQGMNQTAALKVVKTHLTEHSIHNINTLQK